MFRIQTTTSEKIIFSGNVNRKWHVVQKATDEETPDELRNKKVKEATVVKFSCDKKYSAIPNMQKLLNEDFEN